MIYLIYLLTLGPGLRQSERVVSLVRASRYPVALAGIGGILHCALLTDPLEARSC
jgi:hypothetical protein